MSTFNVHRSINGAGFAEDFHKRKQSTFTDWSLITGMGIWIDWSPRRSHVVVTKMWSRDEMCKKLKTYSSRQRVNIKMDQSLPHYTYQKIKSVEIVSVISTRNLDGRITPTSAKRLTLLDHKWMSCKYTTLTCTTPIVCGICPYHLHKWKTIWKAHLKQRWFSYSRAGSW